eukprot:232405-Chlamydomonas_euryale.AAC.2
MRAGSGGCMPGRVHGHNVRERTTPAPDNARIEVPQIKLMRIELMLIKLMQIKWMRIELTRIELMPIDLIRIEAQGSHHTCSVSCKAAVTLALHSPFHCDPTLHTPRPATHSPHPTLHTPRPATRAPEDWPVSQQLEQVKVRQRNLHEVAVDDCQAGLVRRALRREERWRAGSRVWGCRCVSLLGVWLWIA